MKMFIGKSYFYFYVCRKGTFYAMDSSIDLSLEGEKGLGRPSKYVNTSENTLSIRKIGKYVYFYINGGIVDKIPSEKFKFSGDNICLFVIAIDDNGDVSPDRQRVAFDYLIVAQDGTFIYDKNL